MILFSRIRTRNKMENDMVICYALFLFLQEIQAEDLPFSWTITSLHLKIIQNLLGCSANPRVIKRICEFLVAIHPTYETLVIHAPSNLYFAPNYKLHGKLDHVTIYKLFNPIMILQEEIEIGVTLPST